MRIVSSPRLALLNSSKLNFYAKALVEDGDGILRDCNSILGIDFFDGATWTENIDQPVASGTITLRREGIISGTVISLSPSMTASPANHKADTTYSPILAAGRRVQILVAWTVPDVAPVSGDWMLVFDGKIDTVNWKGQDSIVTLDVRDRGGWLQDTFIENVKTYSDTTGIAVELVMQQILNDNPQSKLGAVTLYTPTSPGWNIRAFSQDQKSVLDALRDLAQQIGWDVRYIWRESSGAFELTFSQPDRAKSVADWTLGPDQYVDVSDLKQADANVRNRIRVRATSPTGTPITSLQVSNSSVLKFGERYMEVNEEATSNIDTQGEADAMASAMLSDLSDPIADQEIENYLYPPAQLGDLGKWLANGKQYDADQNFAVIQVKHEFSKDKRRTYIQSRGVVAGAFNAWLLLENKDGAGAGSGVDPTTLVLKDWKEIRRTATDITFGFTASPAVTKIALFQFTQPADATIAWPDGTTAPFKWLTPDTTEITVPFPPDGNTTYLSVEPYSDAGGVLTRGEVVQQRVFASNAKPSITNEAQQTAISGLFTAVSFDVVDAKLLGGTVKAWTNRGSEDSADSSAAPDGTVAVAATPSHLDATTVFTKGDGTTATLLANIPVHPGRGKRIFFEFINTQGTSSGIVAINLLSMGGIIDETGNIIDGTIKAASQFAAAIQPVQLLGSLPAGAADGTVVLLSSDGQLYRRVGGVWTLEVPAVNISGEIVTAQIANAAISTAKFAAGIKPVELLATTTGIPGVNRVALNTTDGKLYRSAPDGSVWVATVGAGDLAGQITTTQITPGAVTTPILAANAVTAANIAANTITASEIAANTITAGQIAAGAISTTQLAANAVTAAKIAVGTITANEIAGATITAAKIVSATITATQIASGTITSTQLSANSIIAGKIAAGAINSSSLFVSGVVTATIISVSNLAAISSDLGIIVTGRLNSANGHSYLDLSATGASPFLHHETSGAVVTLELLANGSATFSGALSAATGTFAGSLSAATGTFSGDISAATGTFSGTVGASSFTSATINITGTDAALNFPNLSSSGAGLHWTSSGNFSNLLCGVFGGVGFGVSLSTTGFINLNPSGTVQVNGKALTFGAANSFSAGFRTVSIAN